MIGPRTVAELLAFERAWSGRPAHDGTKEHAARDLFGLGSTAYAQRLNAVLDTVEALEVDPMTTGRLLRLRDSRRRARRPLEPVE